MRVFILVVNSEKIEKLKNQGPLENIGCIEIKDDLYGNGIMVPEGKYYELFTDPDWDSVFDELNS